jgi:DNA primase
VSPRYAPDDIDEVRERADIVEIVGEHVKLRKAGRSYVGLCPFHQEKTGSFNVDPDKKVYFCHGCQAGGSIFTFIEQVDGVTFPEAVEVLAQRYGVQLREMSGTKKTPSKRARLLEVHDVAVQKYAEMLASKDGVAIRSYLESRGIAGDEIARYRIGFGGWKRDGLVRSLMRRGFTGEELQAAGIATRDAGGIRDTFSGRVLFPIFDPSGRAVAFGGRIVPPEHRPENYPEGPKYLNSRESSIFKKSKILYGTNWARASVMSAKRLVLVEGYTDVIALHLAGIGEAVATCGTALTEDHMKEISTRFGDVRVILCLDSDAAGQQAMSRDRTEELAGAFSPGDQVRGSGWLPVGRGWLPEVHVATLPQGKDPADFVRAEGPDGVRSVLDHSVPLVEFLLHRALEGNDLRSPDGRARGVRRGIDVLKEVGDTLLRHEYALWLADRAGVEAYEVTRALDAAPATPQRRAPTGSAPQLPVKLTGHHRVEREALRSLFAFPDLFDDEQLAITENEFTLPLHRSLFRLASTERTADAKIDAGRIVSRVEDPELQRFASELSVGEGPEAPVARDTLIRLKVFALERYIVERKERLRSLDPNRDAAAYDALFEELLELEKKKRAIAGGGSGY